MKMNTMGEDLRARVFVSCGQKKGSKEAEVAVAIGELLESMGFEPYVAIEQQSLQGLRENIFSHLETSEYFLFVDFQRELLGDGLEHRGSPFCHQELAIASYLGLEVIAFQQRGVKELDGMLGCFQVNPIAFENPAELPEMVSNQVKTAGWRSGWKNMLEIKWEPEGYDDPYLLGQQESLRARYFHLSVRNLNFREIALNCIAYVKAMKDLTTGKSMAFRTTELKWAGYRLPNVAIMPRSHRELDAFLVFHDRPNVVHFSCFTDSTYHMQPIQGPGEFGLTYTVISENFPASEATFRIQIGNSIDDIEISPAAHEQDIA